MPKLEPGDLMTLETYARERPAFRARVLEHKQARKVALGAHLTLLFEDRLTIQYQVQEMLRIERIFEAAGIRDELDAYNPLIPNGSERVATLMFEIDDEARRDRELRRLTGVEDHIYIDVGGLRITAEPERDVERTKDDGKTSSVHFLHFPFKLQEIEKFRDPGVQAILAIAHPNYGHMAMLTPETRAALAADFA